jgi:hypothetical protein
MLILAPVDWSGRHSTTKGLAAKVRPRRRQRRRGDSTDAPRKASAWSGNQQTTLTDPILKEIVE